MDAWQNLFLVLGSTAASLIGLVFVAVSIGVSLKQPRKGLGEFTGQTIVNFTIALASCVVSLSPAGLNLTVDETYVTFGRFHLPSTIQISAHFPSYGADGTVEFTNYREIIPVQTPAESATPVRN